VTQYATIVYSVSWQYYGGVVVNVAVFVAVLKKVKVPNLQKWVHESYF